MNERQLGALKRLERALTLRDTLTVCVLVHDDEEQRDVVGRSLAETGPGYAQVALEADRNAGTNELIAKLQGAGGTGAIGVTGIARWPGGVGGFAGMLNRASERLREACPRPVLVWVHTSDADDFAAADAASGTRHDGFFDFGTHEDEPA